MSRLISTNAAKVLNEIYEQDFLPCSFGFRPKIGCHHALATINELQYKWKLNYALEVDIRDFFGSLKHDWLRKFLDLRIGDNRVLKLMLLYCWQPQAYPKLLGLHKTLLASMFVQEKSEWCRELGEDGRAVEEIPAYLSTHQDSLSSNEPIRQVVIVL